MKKLFPVLVFLATVCVFGCKNMPGTPGSGGGNPKEVLSNFFDAISKKDMVRARSLATPESDGMISMIESQMKTNPHAEDLQKYDRSKMTFGDPVISGDEAKVPVMDNEKKMTMNFPLKKVNGDWKVEFDMGSMMSMGMDAMKQNNIDLGDSLSKDMRKMGHVNMDSLKQVVNRALDSAKFNINH